MVKKITFILLIIVLCLSFTSCEKKYKTEACTDLVAKEDKNFDVPVESFYNITKNKDETYTIKLLDKYKKVVDEFSSPKEPHIKKLENGVIQIIISYGSPFYTTYFYDTKVNLISQIYDTPILVEKGKIVLMNNGKLLISDIFNKNLYCKEVKRNFSQTVPPSSAIISAKFVNSNELQIDYYEGKDFIEKSEIIDLSQ